VVDQFFPGAGLDAITLIEQQGIRVHFPRSKPAAANRLTPAVSPTKHARSRHINSPSSQMTGQWLFHPVHAPA
jgi:hypothetical protein